MNPCPSPLQQKPADRQLVLGSASPFRRQLLERLGLSFVVEAPNIDEQPLPGESSRGLVLRLAEAKAREAGKSHANALVIGSDQVATIDGLILGKPGGRENAIQQLTEASGKRVVFHTGLCLLDTATGREQVACEPFSVYFRRLSRSRIERYLDQEQPYSCAGSFKSEGLGITLFERMEGDDQNSLVGLPLIRLVSMLAREGVELP